MKSEDILVLTYVGLSTVLPIVFSLVIYKLFIRSITKTNKKKTRRD